MIFVKLKQFSILEKNYVLLIQNQIESYCFLFGWLWVQIINMLTAQQFHKHSVALFSQIQNTDTYDHLRLLLFSWRDSPKTAPLSISTFLKVLQLIVTEAPESLDDLNRCLAKEYTPPQSTSTSLERVRRLALENPNASCILDSVLAWLRAEQTPAVTASNNKSVHIEDLSEQEFLQRLQRHQRRKEISKIIYVYRRCIITLKEFKSLLESIYFTDVSFFNMLYQYAEQLQAKRRKVTIFAALNELVDQKYPVQQVGNSYILIPDGYANWGRNWPYNPLENTLNRLCVSVPLGTEGNFLITRKNEFQEQLLRNQQEKYQIDSNLLSLQAAIRIIEKTKRLTHPLVQRILSNIYTGEVVGIMMRNPNAEVARLIVIPRLKQKLAQLLRCRAKFQKTCEQVASKNFYKSLDYRCFYFCKNDKKFNCPARWQKEIELRRKQVLQERGEDSIPQIQDRESLQHSRYFVLNSFDNITTQQIIPEKSVSFQKRPQGLYPRFPQNQVLFLLDFCDSALLNEVLEVLLYHTQKKSLLELMVFKMMKVSIERKLQKYTSLLQVIQGRPIEFDIPVEPLNQPKSSRRVYKDLTDEFLQLIEEEIEPAKVEELPFPFEGPDEHTFIGTKQCYYFIRYLLTIYQRFARAKALAEQRKEEPSLYSQFLAVLIHKLKQQKGLEEYLRKIFQQDAFIFFTLDKLMLGLVKLINNFNADSLTHKLLKEGVRDYDLQIRKWEDYPHATVTEQLSRLYREQEMLFRFTYSSKDKLVFISAWENGVQGDKKKKEGDSGGDKNILPFLNCPVQVSEHKERHDFLRFNASEYVQDDNGTLLMIGEESLVNKRVGQNLNNWAKQLQRFKKVKLF